MLLARVTDDAPADLVWRRLRVLLDGHTTDMLRFIERTYGTYVVDEAWEEFVCFDDVEYDPESPHVGLFTPWVFHCWAPDPDETVIEDATLHGKSPTALYLERQGRRIDPLLRRYLESLLAAPFAFFDVVSCDSGRSARLRDIMTGEEHQVLEREATRNLQPGDILFGQIAKMERLTMLEAVCGFVIAPAEKQPIVELRSRIASERTPITAQVMREYSMELRDLYFAIHERAFNPSPPALQNTDGEPLSLRKLVFDLDASPQAAFDALKHLALETGEDLLATADRDAAGNLARIDFTWKKGGNRLHPEWETTVLGRIEIDGARLTAEVNSQPRADAVAQLIESSLGERAQFRVTQVQSMEKLLADPRLPSAARSAPQEEHDRLAALPEVREEVAAMMAAHFEHWVDQPLPALDGRTPRDAVKDADGREIVESLVVQAERYGRAMNPPTDAAVFRRLRERLGLSVT